MKPPTRCVLLFVFRYLNWRYLVPTWGYGDFFGLDKQGRCLSGDPSTELVALRHHESCMTPPFPPAKTETPIPQKMEVGKHHINIVTNGTCFASVWGYGKHLIPKNIF